MRSPIQSIRRAAGFSLIEVMIAVVVLAVGLLALVALQSRLVREGADAKARSRIASLISSRIDGARAGGYYSLESAGAVQCAAGNDICQAQADAAVTGLSVGQVVEPVSTALSEYKTLTVTANWTDAAGKARALSMRTIISPLSLDTTGTALNQQFAGDIAKVPVVRTSNPATPGMIPVAVSATDSTAATNPRPELLSKGNKQAVTGTKFDVLTYTNESASTARIQRRVETTVIKCTCQYGAGGSNLPEIYREAQWPAVWTGERYDIFKPETRAAPAGAAVLSGPAAGVVQSPLCTECCRDHHDPASTAVAKFDPERTARNDGTPVHSHYTRNTEGHLVIVPPGGGGTYEESCRMIRVDGLWRTAADMYNRYTGLLATATAPDKTAPATTGVPEQNAADNYGGSRDRGINGFVKDVLAAYRSNGWRMDLEQASALYEGAGLNSPAELTIRRPTPSSSDQRYLHLRGLYVDKLESTALERIRKATQAENCESGNTFECVLPYLPFTTVNLTELAFWKSETKPVDAYVNDSSILKVETASTLTFSPTEPYRGRTNALASAQNDDVAYASAMVTRSNTGVAVVAQGVDPEDDLVWSLETDEANAANWVTDRQRFRVSAPDGTGGTEMFWVRLLGLPHTVDKETTNDPHVDWFVSTSAGSCGGTFSSRKDTDPNDYSCNNTPTLGGAGTVRVSEYYMELSESVFVSETCDYQGSPVSVSGTVSRPYFRNFQVGSASVDGVAGTLSVASDGKVTEATGISFSALPANGVVSVSFTEQPRINATLASCTAIKRGNSYDFGTITWNRSWTQ